MVKPNNVWNKSPPSNAGRSQRRTPSKQRKRTPTMERFECQNVRSLWVAKEYNTGPRPDLFSATSPKASRTRHFGSSVKQPTRAKHFSTSRHQEEEGVSQCRICVPPMFQRRAAVCTFTTSSVINKRSIKFDSPRNGVWQHGNGPLARKALLRKCALRKRE